MSYLHFSCKGSDEMKQKDFQFFLNCESAVSEIIGAIMLLAIAVGIIALIQTLSVPEWNKAVEMDHYNVVYDDFMKIRSDIENVALFQFPKSSVIHMCAHYPERMIFINPAGTSGTLTSENVWINVSYTDSTGNATYKNFTSTSIRFEPNYNYYSNAASLVYEHGLVIKDFTDSNYLYTDTSQGIFNNITKTINVLSFDYPLESVSFSDINTMNYYPNLTENTKNNTNVTVTFYTNYPLLWKELFKKYNFTYYDVSDNNTLKFDYQGNITINAYTVNGSISSGIGVYSIPETQTPPPIITRDVNLTNISALSNTTLAGTNSTYYLKLTNNGTDPDTYTITVSNPNGSSIAVTNITSIPLNAGANAIFTLNVTNPSSGTFLVNVTATSVSDSTKSGYINITTIVTSYVVNNAIYYLENNATNRSVGADGITNYTASGSTITIIPYKNLLKNGTMGTTTTLTFSAPKITPNIEAFRFYLPFNYSGDTNISANTGYGITWGGRSTGSGDTLTISLFLYNFTTGGKSQIGTAQFTVQSSSLTLYTGTLNNLQYTVPKNSRLMVQLNLTTTNTGSTGTSQLQFNDSVSSYINLTETQIV